MQLTVKATSARDSAEDCRRSAVASLVVLRRYRIANITSAKLDWWTDDATTAVLMHDSETDEPLGGVRLQRWGSGAPLPLESALARVDPRVHGWLAGFAGRGGVGELCGLWRAPRLRGFGLGARLTSMGIALADQLGMRTLVGLCDTRSLAPNLRLGFVVDPALAAGGRFPYPRAGLYAHVLRVPDTRRLPGATADARAAIGGYRARPVGVERIVVGQRELRLDRDLRGVG